MPLILAIEPDRRQAAHLTAVVRERVGAELILVGTTEHALNAIGNRVPDLILVPALLSPQDDAALATALRVIAAAANVQMLTIPVLGAVKAQKSGGVLSALRRSRKSAEPEGCDPTVFAEQIASYLERAVQERAEAVKHADHHEYVAPPPPERVEPEIVAEFDAAEPEAEPEAIAPPAEDVEQPAEPLEQVATAEAVAPIEAEVETAEPTHPADGQPVERIEVAAITDQEPIYVEPDFVLDVETPVADIADVAPALVPIAEVEPALAASADVDPFLAASADEDVSLALEEAVRALFADEPSAPEPHAEPPSEAVAEPLWTAAPEPFEVEALPVQLEVEPLPEPLDVEPVPEPLDVEPLPELLDVEPVPQPLDVEPLSELFDVEPLPAPMADVVNTSEQAAVDDLIAALEEIPLAALQVTEGSDWGPPSAEDPESVLAGMSIDLQEFVQDPTDPPVPVTDSEPAEAMVSAAETIESTAAAFDAVAPPIAAPPQAATPAPAVPAPEPAHIGGKSEREWVALIESLRHDVERLRNERAEKPAAAKPAPRPAGPRAAKASKKAKPVQDEWGFFDPEQCGFAALLAKLDEVTENDDRRT